VRVVLVLDRFPAPSEGFIVDKVIGLLRRGVDLHVVCWELDDATLDLHPELAGSEVRGRIHAFPGRNARGVLALVARTIRSARRRPRTTARLLSTLPGSGTELARRLGTEATIAALDPDVVHFEFGWVAIRHIRLGDALPVPLTMSVRGADVAYHGLDRDDTYGEVWPRLAGLHCLGDDLWQRAQQRGCPSSMPVARIPPAVDVDRFTGRRGSSTVSTPCAASSTTVSTCGTASWAMGRTARLWRPASPTSTSARRCRSSAPSRAPRSRPRWRERTPCSTPRCPRASGTPSSRPRPWSCPW
jgi:hypothetical protein